LSELARQRISSARLVFFTRWALPLAKAELTIPEWQLRDLTAA
jgi:hypothetical protein